MDRDEAVRVAVEALVDASQEDVATGGVDPARGIYPTVVVVTAEGAEPLSVKVVTAAYDALSSSPPGSAGASVAGGAA
jgi:proteasome beta subunit